MSARNQCGGACMLEVHHHVRASADRAPSNKSAWGLGRLDDLS
jgi:hypothetical protein